jgi:hypothetical protein
MVVKEEFEKKESAKVTAATSYSENFVTYFANLTVLEVRFHLHAIGRVTSGGFALRSMFNEGNVKFNVSLPFFPLLFRQSACSRD